MEPLLRIKDWRKRYEIAQSRIVKTLTWVAEPNGAEASDLDLSRRKLLRKPGGLEAWAVYELLIKITSRLPALSKGWAKSKRMKRWHYFDDGRSLCRAEEFGGGVNEAPNPLAPAVEICSECSQLSQAIDTDRPDLPTRGYLAGGDAPWSSSDLEVMIDVDSEAIAKALTLLTAPAIGLVERLHPETFTLLDGDSGGLWDKPVRSETAGSGSEPIDAMSELGATGPDGSETHPQSPLIDGYESAPATGQERNEHERQDRKEKPGKALKDDAVPSSSLSGSAVADRPGAGGVGNDGAVPAPEMSGSAIADRRDNRDNRDLARAVWLVATEPLWGSFKTGGTGGSDTVKMRKRPRNDAQWKRDRSSCENLFDEKIWPVGQITRPNLIDYAMTQVTIAAERGDRPMAYLTDAIKNEYGVTAA